MTIRKVRITHDPNLYGTRYVGEDGRMAEAIRCYAGEWMTCYYLNGKQLYFGRTVPNVSPQKAKMHGLAYALEGKLPEGMVAQ